MTEHRERLERIRQKLVRASRLHRKSSSAYLQAKDQANFRRFFGADKHQFKINKTLSSSHIEAWEAEHNATLPGAYRAFLEQIGDGGAGPLYGLLPLREWDMGIYLTDETRRKQSASQPSLLIDRLYKHNEDNEGWLAEIAGPDWEEKLDRDEWWPTVGAITICEHGCGMYEYLILNGPLQGRVFFMNWLDPPVFTKGNFLDWYEGWLDYVLEAEENKSAAPRLGNG